ncbi:MAG: exodeoxyribonuclease VII small subunit [Clostridia bacterium]|nr:exodeoxyribonuclease VII small subunit [Clostridia bacterium]
MSNEKLTFEEAMELLENNADKLKSGRLSLEESVKAYENCAKYHKICTEILSEIKQKIEVYRPDSDSVEPFED